MYYCPVCGNSGRYQQHHEIPASLLPASLLDRRKKSRGSDRRDALRRLLDRLGLRRTGPHVARHPEQDGPK